MFTTAALKPLLVGLGVTVSAAVASRVVPAEYAANLVAAIFVGTTYVLVLNKSAATAAEHGLSLGGLFEPQPLNARRIARELSGAIGWALLLSLITFPAFWLGYRVWFGVDTHFGQTLPPGFGDLLTAQLLVIALPEEMFYRGYLQSALAKHDTRRFKFLGAQLGPSLFVSSAIFALGHMLATPYVTRLAVFFPSLVFGWLRARTGGVGSSVIYHAACNVFSATLAHGSGLN